MKTMRRERDPSASASAHTRRDKRQRQPSCDLDGHRTTKPDIGAKAAARFPHIGMRDAFASRALTSFACPANVHPATQCRDGA
jgi:hypothetical protein